MPVVLWKLPVAATGIIRGPDFTVLPQRRCEIAFLAEASDEGEQRIALIFEFVQAFKCTYMGALDVAMINATYGRLIDIGQSPWLAEVHQRATAYYKRLTGAPLTLRHLAIGFDDGPCFEIICTNFKPKLPEGLSNLG